MDLDNVLPFRQKRNDMGRKKAANKLIEETQHLAEMAKEHLNQVNAPERKSIVLPAEVWRLLEEDAENQFRTLSRHIEWILINHYNLKTRKKASINNSGSGSSGFVQYVDTKAS